MVEETNKHFGLALTSLILGGVSLLSFMLYGLSAIPALICLIKGQKHVRVMGGIGMAVCILGIIAAVAMVYLYASMINWQNVNMDAFQSLQNIDQTDKTQVTEWVQQFFKMDIYNTFGNNGALYIPHCAIIKEKDIFYDPLDQKNGQTDINPGGMEVKKRKLPAACFFVDYRTQTVPDNKNKK